MNKKFETAVDLILPFWTDDTFQIMLVVLPADELLDLQQINKISQTQPRWSVRTKCRKSYWCFFLSPFRAFTQNTFLLILFWTLAQFSYFCSFHRSLVTTISLSVGGSLLCERRESVQSSLSWCDMFLTFHFYPAAPLLLPKVVFFPFTTWDMPSISVVSYPLDLRIKWLLNYRLGTFLFSSIKYFSKVKKNEQKIE